MSAEGKIGMGKARCIRETAKAILVVLEDDENRELWVPQSAVHDDSDVYQLGQRGNLVVVEWFGERETSSPTTLQRRYSRTGRAPVRPANKPRGL